MAKSLVTQALETIGKRWDLAQSTRNGQLQHTAAFAKFCASKYGLDRIGGLKPHMVKEYVKSMQERGVKGRSIANHLSAVRTLAHAIGKANIVARENKAYISKCTRMNPIVQNYEKVMEIRTALQERAENGDRTAMMMQAAAALRDTFGLRAEESLMSSKVKENRLSIEGTKGGRPRALEIRTQEQRAAIELLHKTAELLGSTTGRIIPPELNLKQAMNIQRIQWARLGGTKANKAHMHAARHAYAQRRLSEGATRMQVSLELGHGRIEITGNYSPK